MHARHVTPSFVERTSYGVKETNPYNKLFEERIIFLGTQIDDTAANDVVAQLIALEAMDPDRDISLYINSPGGTTTAMTAIYDTMRYVRPGIADIERDRFMTAVEAREYGLIDELLTTRKPARHPG